MISLDDLVNEAKANKKPINMKEAEKLASEIRKEEDRQRRENPFYDFESEIDYMERQGEISGNVSNLLWKLVDIIKKNYERIEKVSSK